MNLIAMIGIVDSFVKDATDSKLYLKVEKPFFESQNIDDIYESIQVSVNSSLFKDDIDFLEKGTLIGLKGRIKNSENNNLQIIAERIQVF
ncbi:MAG: OB-fold nucleic acid binding domain-containing protein [Malacoplasma sp.]|nr:OB-fold nucleic acid binding domain-containing protein [Malacoplasma sp.]